MDKNPELSLGKGKYLFIKKIPHGLPCGKGEL
jgi:hypothetical protein